MRGESSPEFCVSSSSLLRIAYHLPFRGPEIENWFGTEDGVDPAIDNDWNLLPFMALSDGAHTATEDFSYFTLRKAATNSDPATSLFGISCTRQIDAADLKVRPPDVTRSTVQKAVVVIAQSPQHFGQLREKLSIVTQAWFSQKDFTDTQILKDFQESLAKNMKYLDDEPDQFLGLGLREFIHDWKSQTLVLFKCCLLQPKDLQDCADPALDNHEKAMVMPTSLKSSDRNSLLAYMGLPLQVFGKGAFFGPYTPLQQLDILADRDTKSYMVGSTNSLLLQQRDRYSDILINLDEGTINITSPSLRQALSLSAADRRWVDSLTQTVNETWDEVNPSRPNTLGYAGSEEYIRNQFEEYLLSFLSTLKYHIYLQAAGSLSASTDPPSPAPDFSMAFLNAFTSTHAFTLFNTHTSPHLFDLIPPQHPTSGPLSLDDVSRRLTQQIESLHLDERVREGRENLSKHLAAGRAKASSAMQNLWAEVEALREAQRRRQMEAAANSPANESMTTVRRASVSSQSTNISRSGPDASQVQASVSAAGQRASSYVAGWGSWAADRIRGSSHPASSTTDASSTTSPISPTSSIQEREKENERTSGSWGGVMARWRGSGIASTKRSSYEKEKDKENRDDGIERLDA
ncbi:MAG: late secretory pathway protein avl9 [Cirrosporium novae-zelandiae]|nr:MAG: late secretory pathway protein avl9 [Cirrosporium novae-zelandiae]